MVYGWTSLNYVYMNIMTLKEDAEKIAFSIAALKISANAFFDEDKEKVKYGIAVLEDYLKWLNRESKATTPV